MPNRLYHIIIDLGHINFIVANKVMARVGLSLIKWLSWFIIEYGITVRIHRMTKLCFSIDPHITYMILLSLI